MSLGGGKEEINGPQNPLGQPQARLGALPMEPDGQFGPAVEDGVPGSVPGAPADRQAGTDGWSRVHPVTPLVQGWKFFVAIAAGFTHISINHGLKRPDWADSGTVALSILGFVLAGTLLVAGISWLSWIRTSYRVTDTVVEVRSGILARKHRQARLDRLQAVDIVRPLMARLAGLSELKMEVAGGSSSEVRLAYLREDFAQNLRNVLLARAAGISVEPEVAAPEAPEVEVAKITTSRLIKSIAYSGIGVFAVLCVLSVIALPVIFTLTTDAGAAFDIVFVLMTAYAPMLLAIVAACWSLYSMRSGFTVASSPDGLRIRHGLLETSSQTVPPGRVQAITVSQSLFWRKSNWWSIQVNVAGYRPGTGDRNSGARNYVMPVATVPELVAIFRVILPRVPEHELIPVLQAAGVGNRTHADGFTPAPPASRILDPFAWNRLGFKVVSWALVERRGWLTRRFTVVPHARAQSWGLTQGPLQRWCGVATLDVHSTPGPAKPTVLHQDAKTIAALLTELQSLARASRREDSPAQWMTAQQ